MKGKTIFGALLVSVALCSQGFGFELLDRMLGLNYGGCGECKACAKVACCEKACCSCSPLAVRSRPAAKRPRARSARSAASYDPVRDLFGELKEMFEAKGCCCESRCAARRPLLRQACLL